jgi:hypothetical protein
VSLHPYGDWASTEHIVGFGGDLISSNAWKVAFVPLDLVDEALYLLCSYLEMKLLSLGLVKGVN